MATLCAAVSALRSLGQLLGVSRLYQSDPVGGPSQGTYLNAAVHLQTSLDAFDALEQLQVIENRHGRDREREGRWGPRTLDLDILWAQRLTETGHLQPLLLETAKLVVPHPRLLERAFTLLPLLDLLPGVAHPSTGEPLEPRLLRLKHQRIEVVHGTVWGDDFFRSTD